METLVRSNTAEEAVILTEGECVDLDDYNLTTEQRRTVRQLIKEDTLEYMNKRFDKVKPRKSIYTIFVKRMIDIFVSFLALTVTLPINLIIGICTYFDVGNPIFFKQERCGKNGKIFRIVKFRNMTNETDGNGELLPPKDRVTKFGKFVRKTSLDELLNFWSIFKGDMSLIGPRPLVDEYTTYMSDRHRMRSAVRPGLECPVIIETGYESSWSEQFENDVYYVENVSFMLDVKMIFKLVQMVFNRKSSSVRGNVQRGSFMGYDTDGNSIISKKVPRKYIDKILEMDKD
ncbi:MAG: sugar transferase [Ruminococcus sp.]|nr:sugar transferase [Ruminococcus sp.]